MVMVTAGLDIAWHGMSLSRVLRKSTHSLSLDKRMLANDSYFSIYYLPLDKISIGLTWKSSRKMKQYNT